jgi:hypothetical protein
MRRNVLLRSTIAPTQPTYQVSACVLGDGAMTRNSCDRRESSGEQTIWEQQHSHSTELAPPPSHMHVDAAPSSLAETPSLPPTKLISSSEDGPPAESVQPTNANRTTACLVPNSSRYITPGLHLRIQTPPSKEMDEPGTPPKPLLHMEGISTMQVCAIAVECEI